MDQTEVHCWHLWKCSTGPPMQLIYAIKMFLKRKEYLMSYAYHLKT
jgi:hypothetical protein